MFDFQNLEVYKKAKTFHLNCIKILKDADELSRILFSMIKNLTLERSSIQSNNTRYKIL